MSVVIFTGNTNTPLNEMNPLWLESITRKNGKIVSGRVINGHWDLKVTDTEWQAGGFSSNSKYCTVTSSKIPEEIIEVSVTWEWGDYDNYNEVIYTAMKIAGNPEKLIANEILAVQQQKDYKKLKKLEKIVEKEYCNIPF